MGTIVCERQCGYQEHDHEQRGEQDLKGAVLQGSLQIVVLQAAFWYGY